MSDSKNVYMFISSYQRCPWGMWLGFHCGHSAPVTGRQLVAGAGVWQLRIQGGVQVGFLSVGRSGACWEGCRAVTSVHLPVVQDAFCESWMSTSENNLLIWIRDLLEAEYIVMKMIGDQSYNLCESSRSGKVQRCYQFVKKTWYLVFKHMILKIYWKQGAGMLDRGCWAKR